MQLLVNEGAEVVAFDPSQPSAAMLPPRLQIILAPTALDAVEDVDALAILTDWREFAEVPLGEVVERMRGDLVLDGRNVLEPDDVHHVGLRYLGVGRGRARQPQGVRA